MRCKKFLVMVMAGILVAAMLSVPALAADSTPNASVTDNAGSGNYGSDAGAAGDIPGAAHSPPDSSLNTGTSPSAFTGEIAASQGVPYPTDIQLLEQGDRNYMYKTYTVAANYDPDLLVEPSFSQGGFRYRFSEIIQRDSTPASASKVVTEVRTVDSETGDQAEIMEKLGNKLSYSDEEGYEGELFIVPETLVTTETGRTSYSYTLTDTKIYDNLDSNDMSYIPKTTTKSGVTLTLQDVDWQVTGSQDMGYSGVATNYTAVALYSAPATGSKASGYTSTVSFSGEVVKPVIGKNTYTIVYEGEKIVIPFNYMPLIIACAVALVLLIVLVTLWKLRKNVEVYVYQQGVPELYSKIRVSHKKPVIELRQLSDVEIRLIFDKFFAKRLLDQRIFVISKYRNVRFDLDGMQVVDLNLAGADGDDNKNGKGVMDCETVSD